MRSASIVALVLLSVLAACAKPMPAPEPVAPVSVEPTFTGKYK